MEAVEVSGHRLLLASCTGPYLCVAELHDDYARPLMALGSVISVFLRDGAPPPEVVLAKRWDDPAQLAWAKEKYPALFSGVGQHLNRDFHELIQESIRRGKPARSQFLWTDGNGAVDLPEPVARRPWLAQGAEGPQRPAQRPAEGHRFSQTAERSGSRRKRSRECRPRSRERQASGGPVAASAKRAEAP
ncbi:MAG: hypothetical protein GW880_28785 [Armatimonadetes bacterium]|nr:hypothetical protein [Armatimonadota bacterium]